MARRRGLTVATGSAAVVVLTTASGALINELHGGWGWWVATAAVVLAMAALTWWLAAQQDGSAQAAPRPTVIVSSHVDRDAAWHETGLRYEDRADGGRIHIEPRDPYLDLVRGGGELTPVKYWHSPWERRFRWPTLDVKVVNNTGRAVMFHRAVFQVARSRPDLRAIPLVHDIAYGTYLPLVNAGWGEMTDCVLRFRIHAGDAPVTGELEWRFGTVEGAYREEELRGFFADAGVDFAALERLGPEAPSMIHFLPPDAAERTRRALGPFADGFATLRGTLTYTHVGAHGRPEQAAHPIVSHVSFGEHPVGAPAPPTYTYQVRLRTEGSDYEVDVPVSQAISPGDTDRFAFTIAASRSSFHDLTLLLRYNDEAPIVSDPVSLELFASRFDMRYQEFG
jgi:hypothetical protein